MQPGVELVGRVPQLVQGFLDVAMSGQVIVHRVQRGVDECGISLLLADEFQRHGAVSHSLASSRPGIRTINEANGKNDDQHD